MNNLPEPRRPSVVNLPDGTPAYTDHLPTTYQPTNAVPQVIHVHQAPPDRTVQRLALGSGMGAGMVAAGVYFGPLLVGVLTAIAANLALLALVAAVCAWGVVTVVKSVGGTTGKTPRKRR
ncbi:hypothetical protein J7F02_01485 [Streptomyces sp. ISL-112]|uniref:DUF6251 family protein n=1 Tax=unclassified Streptomyces TaxID=2593676 RepID=UPI001BE7FCD3|nr:MULTISPECIES: DUF6251 family protein [unclassified Streptomyces]MBT2424413.1 hypothetical protein [Streptomyces sp. ISL-112]MBT2464948.1 hypothetical protein [Streptomyces sp. ISL-63]